VVRLLHTADWHLGRVLHGSPLIEDQRYVLDQLVAIAADAAVDAVLIAGDVYDRAVPQPEAVELLDEVLTRLVVDAGLPVVMIAGNHDSPERLGFASRVLLRQGLHVAAYPGEFPLRLPLRDAHGTVQVVAVPYAEPSLVRARVPGAAAADHDAAMAVMVRQARALVPAGDRSVLVAHAFAAGGIPSESERPLVVGGSGRVAVTRLREFDYVALGHLHRPQRVTSDRIQYSGSLLKYSFEESTQPKSVNVVDLDAAGNVGVERVPLRPLRDVRCLRGRLDDLLRARPDDERAGDYLMFRLTDRQPIFDALGKLRAVYPNVLHIERSFPDVAPALPSLQSHRRLEPDELFELFFAEVTGDELDDDQRRLFAAALQSLREREREVVS